jgi:ATP-dependent Clp protease, proteolytic subunit ClpP|nr:MAG TPA: Putative ATP dependent Clp protease [Caudoviricetes sp.]
MDIEVKGDIISDDSQWIYDWIGWSYTSARNVLKSLKKANGEDVLVKINSPGGSVFAASEIYTALRGYKGNVNIEIHGLAASAASVIAMAGHCKMSPTGQMMVHNVSTSGVDGDYRVMEHTAEMLRNANMTIANAYIDKTGMSEEEALNLMDNETWLSAERALELGMIDEIMFRNTNINIQNKQLKGLYNSFSSIPKELLDQLEKIKDINFSQPNLNNEKVDFLIQKAQAELELLKLRGGKNKHD